jgi:hypothetical protein
MYLDKSTMVCDKQKSKKSLTNSEMASRDQAAKGLLIYSKQKAKQSLLVP